MTCNGGFLNLLLLTCDGCKKKVFRTAFVVFCVKKFNMKNNNLLKKSCGVFIFAYVALTINKREYCQGANYLYAHLVELLHKNTTMVVKHRKHESTNDLYNLKYNVVGVVLGSTV